ncbi:MAG: hypothetical protein D6701_05765 [Gemmatimonadetes bacterium]|nr:MAG: hypothetical protein D6701_05765 [Gemmatimonadota bacterium]
MSTAPAGIPAERARRVRLVVLDVDGVLTDGGLYVGEDAEGRRVEFKRFDIQDGLGIKMLQWAALEVAVVSGRLSGATAQRARELGIAEVHQDARARKLPIVEELLQRRGLTWEALAVVGDDLADLPLLRRAGLAVAVKNAVPEVASVCHWTTPVPGGSGAVRAFARALLLARGDWDELVERYERDRSGQEELL